MKKIKDMSTKEINDLFDEIWKISEEQISKRDYISLFQDFKAMYPPDEIGLKKFLIEVYSWGQLSVYDKINKE
jgi:hypothetical protein